MKYKISMIIMLAIFLFSITSVCASEIDTPIVSEDTSQMGLSDNDKIEVDNPQTSKVKLELDVNDENLSVQSDTNVLGDSPVPFSDLEDEIKKPGNVIFKYKYYTYDYYSSNIDIDEANKVIDGNGAVIDMAGSNIRPFIVTVSGVTIKNLTIKNVNYNGDGGAIWMLSGSVENCNFVNNSASGDGGAILLHSGSVENCNFVNNSASSDGGAICIMDKSNVTNCNFVNNSASGGGAIFFLNEGNVTNCNFADNSALNGGAILSNHLLAVTADTCIFKTDSDTTFYTHNLSPTLNVDNFTTVYGSGDKLTFDLRTNFTNIPITNGNISISVYLKDNGEWVGNYSCLSGDEWIPDLLVGSYYAIFDTEYAGFKPVNRTITITMPEGKYYVNVTSLKTYNKTVNITAKSNFPNEIIWGGKLLFLLSNGDEIEHNYSSNGTWWVVYTFEDYGLYQVNLSYVGLDNVTVNKGTLQVFAPEHTFWFLNYEINGNDNSVIELSNDFYFDPAYDVAFVDGIVINRPVTIKGNGSAIDAKGQARIFNVNSKGTLIENLTLKNSKASNGGAIIFSQTGAVINSTFINNTATETGGAVYSNKDSTGTVINCTFINNTAYYGGAIRFIGGGTVTNCNFTDNKVTYYGGAVYLNKGAVTNCNFADNSASSQGGAIRFSEAGTLINCNFTNNFAIYGGSVFFYDNGEVKNCNFVNNSAIGDGSLGGAIRMYSGSVENCNFVDNTASSQGGAIRVIDAVAVTNCNFTGNNATSGSAIYFTSSSATKTVSNSRFLNNRANSEALEVTKNENNLTITFIGSDNLLNAIYSPGDVSFTNVTYWGANGIANTDSSSPFKSKNEAGQNITVGVVVNDKIVLNDVKVTDENGMIVLDIKTGENYYISAHHDTDLYYTEAETTISNITFNVNITSQTSHNRTVNITAMSNILSEVMVGNLLFVLPDGSEINATYGTNGTWWAVYTFDGYDVYQVNAICIGLDNVTVINATITIAKEDSSVTLENITLEFGESRNVTVTTVGAIGITAKINDAEIAVINNFTIPISVLALGNHTLTVSTIPDENHNAVTETATITVNMFDLILIIGDMIFDYNSIGSIEFSYVGDAYVNAGVIDHPEAVVDVKNDTIEVSGLNAGTYILNVTAIADDNHNSVSETVNITVKKLKTELDGDAINTSYGVEKDLVITLKDINGNPLGGKNITVDLNDVKTYVSDEKGQVKVSTKGLTPDTYTAKATFDGDTNYEKSANEFNVTITGDKLIVSAQDLTKYYSGPERFIVKVTDTNNRPLADNEVKIMINGVTYSRITDENGTASMNINLNAGEYLVGVKVDDVEVNYMVIVKSTIDANDLVKMFRNETQFYAIFLDVNATPAANINVSFNINGIIYNRTTDAQGIAKLNINLNAGDYIITSINSVTGDMKSNRISVISQIESSDLIKYYKNDSQFVVRIRSADGGYVGAGEEVKFNINGVIYTRTTNATGHAKLNINLHQGNYTITTYYKNCSKGNNIEVLPILGADDLSMKYLDKSQFKVRLVDGGGNPYANQTVAFNINGVFYNRTTDSEGIAKLNINLMSGEYIITSSYNGCNIANTIKISD